MCLDTSATEAVCRDNEMGYMFYHDLGGVFGTSIGTTHNSNYNLFANIQNSFYWSGTEFSSTLAWRFGFDDGSEVSVRDNKISLDFAWAVHPGDVGAAAPEPASLLLMGAGMLGLGWSRRSGRRR